MLIPRDEAFDIRVPYALLQSIGSGCDANKTFAENSLAIALMDMKEMVDDTIFDLQPWQLWKMFGACFYAVRTNALLVLGHSTVTLKDLLPGVVMSVGTSTMSVKLVPSRVIQCAGAFGALNPWCIPQKGNQSETIDWTSGGYIVVTDDGGAGVDIYFALESAATG